jgi:hypothetical protein
MKKSQQLIPVSEAAKKFNRARNTIYELSRLSPPPSFVKLDQKPIQIDIADPAWAKWIKESASRSMDSKPITAGGFALPKTKRPGRVAPDSLDELGQAKINKVIYESNIKRFKADQEEIKTRAMEGQYIDLSLMKYYFSFYQKGIADSFASVKKLSPDLNRLYKADKNKEAEKLLMTELGIAFANVTKALEAEIKKDSKGKNG